VRGLIPIKKNFVGRNGPAVLTGSVRVNEPSVSLSYPPIILIHQMARRGAQRLKREIKISCSYSFHCIKKSFSIFPSPAGMSLTKLSLGGNNLYMTSSLFPPRESLVSDIPAGDGNIASFFKVLVSDEVFPHTKRQYIILIFYRPTILAFIFI
jgi:hypothetical protein